MPLSGHLSLPRQRPYRLHRSCRRLPPVPSQSGIRWNLHHFSCQSLLFSSYPVLRIPPLLLPLYQYRNRTYLEPDVIVMSLLFPVPQILADTFTIPLASISKGNFDLRNASSCRKDAIQTEIAQCLVVFCKLSLTLYYMNVNRCLVIGRSGENLALLCRNCRISLNQSCSYAAHGLNRQ